MTDDTLTTREILKARRRADYLRYKAAMQKKRTKMKQAKHAARKQERAAKAALLQKFIKPATELEQPSQD